MSIQFLKRTQNRFLVTRFASLAVIIGALVLLFPVAAYPQVRSAPFGGQRSVVVDERLAVLRDGPGLSARLLKRLSRGRKVSLINMRRTSDGVVFYRVAVTRRTRGWIQREAIISPTRKGDDERLLSLIRASEDFDRLARASIFLETFPRSALRPEVLLILAAAADKAAKKLSNEAVRRLDEAEMRANRAATFSYFMNFSGLDRYRRLGIDFVFDEVKKQFHYDGKRWREIVRRYPQSAEAEEARTRLDSLASLN